MNDATPVPMIAVEPVLMFRASCFCGWWKVRATEDDAQTTLIGHTLVTRCDGCRVDLDHDAATVHDQDSWAGAFCAACAPHYAPE